VNIADPHNHWGRDKRGFNKQTYLEEMLRLKRESVQKPERAPLNAFLLGNAYFSMTWHGKYWIMSRTWWSMDEFDSWSITKCSPILDNYYGCARARRWYRQCMVTSEDPDLKALACLMVRECDERMRRYVHYASTDHDSPLPTFRDRYGPRLQGRAREAYAQIQECANYEAFIARYR
jgi:hypothetical protein